MGDSSKIVGLLSYVFHVRCLLQTLFFLYDLESISCSGLGESAMLLMLSSRIGNKENDAADQDNVGI